RGETELAPAPGPFVVHVLDRGHQRLVVVAEAEGGVVQALAFGVAQQLQHAQGIEPVDRRGVDGGRALGGAAQRGADVERVRERPAAAQAQYRRIPGIGSGGWRLVGWGGHRRRGYRQAVPAAADGVRMPACGRTCHAVAMVAQPMPTAASNAAYAARIEFIVALAAQLHLYGTTAQRLEGAIEAVARRLGLDCQPMSNPAGLILSFSDPQRPPGDSDITRVIRLP